MLLPARHSAAPAPAPSDPLRTALARCGDPPEPACLAALQAAAIEAAGGRVRAEAGTIALQTASGPVRFEIAQGHHYLGAVPGAQADVVLTLARAAPLSAGRYGLVGPGGPPVLALDDLPWPAPGGRLLAVVRPASGSTPASVALYQRVGPRWTLQYRYEAPRGVSYRFRRWRSDAAALSLDWQAASSKAEPGCAGRATAGVIQLRDGPYGWDLVPPVPRACP